MTWCNRVSHFSLQRKTASLRASSCRFYLELTKVLPNILGMLIDDVEKAMKSGFANRGALIALIDSGALAQEHVDEALTIANVRPGIPAWRQFIDRVMMVLGGLALAFSVMFFVAYNWDDIGKFAQFGLVEAFIAVAIMGFWKLGGDTLGGKISLLVGTLMVGVLLALHGQTYQTGADPWQLFANWALLIVPWVIVGRFAAVWMIWIGLINLSVVLYFQAFLFFSSDFAVGWTIFLVNTAALVVGEYFARRRSWLSERGAFRLLALGSGGPLTWMAAMAIFEPLSLQTLSVVFWAGVLASLYFIYRTKIRDLFMLAGGCLSVIVVTISYLLWLFMDKFEEAGLLLIAVAVIGLAAASAIWLRHVQQEWQA